jgi:cell division protein FtsA
VLYGQVLPPPTIHDLFGKPRRKAASRPAPAEDDDGRQPVGVEVLTDQEEEDDDAPEPSDAVVDVETFTPGVYQPVSQTLVSQILEARLEQIFGLVAAEIRRSGYEGLLPAGVVLTGGTARLPGVAELAQRVLNMPVRVSVPQGITGLTDTLDSPAYATSVGLALWATRHAGAAHPHAHGAPAGQGRGATQVVGRVTGWLREFLP